MEAPIFWNLLAFFLMSTALILIRIRQDAMRREIDSLRRAAHAF